MQKKLTIAVIALCVCMCCLIGVTVAWLTSVTSEVKNTFTVGDIQITLDEANVTLYGVKDGDSRVMTNEYKLIPGHQYLKDPTVTLTAGNEKCYIFIQVRNDIAGIEKGTTIAQQIANNNWIALEEYDGVYYQVIETQNADLKLPVFANFTIMDTADVASYVTNADKDNNIITVKAYAIQYDSFENKVADAWTTVSAAAKG